MSDWGVTLTAAMGYTAQVRPGQRPLDGLNLWEALTTPGVPSPRQEMLLSMRDADECGEPVSTGCVFRGQLAYRKGPMKLIYGHTALRGTAGDVCEWSEGEVIDCWNGWSRPLDLGPPKPPPTIAPTPGQPPNSSVLSW
eukprot:SAG31_NODE_12645_length_927_cov_1.359903_2_plen_138_part_01